MVRAFLLPVLHGEKVPARRRGAKSMGRMRGSRMFGTRL